MMSASRPAYWRSCAPRGFSLIELLVVIGILSLLIALVMPALSRVREQSRRITCLNNMRQIGIAFRLYVSANKEVFPLCGAGSTAVYDAEDWIYWQPARRPNPDLAYGVIVRCLGVSNVRASTFQCPSDDINSHVAFSGAPYPFSYTVNFNICGGTKYTALIQTLSLLQIRNPTEKILLIDEDSLTIDDGAWAPQHSIGGNRNVLSNRHERSIENTANWNDGRGNVAFVDGHADFIPRSDIILPHYYDPNVP